MGIEAVVVVPMSVPELELVYAPELELQAVLEEAHLEIEVVVLECSEPVQELKAVLTMAHSGR